MQRPRRDWLGHGSVNPHLWSIPALQCAMAIAYRKDVVADMRAACENLLRKAWQRNGVALPSLGDAAAKPPGIAVNLGPFHAGCFAAALPTDQHELEAGSKRI